MGVPPGKYFIRVVGRAAGLDVPFRDGQRPDASVVPIDIDSNDIGGRR